ncbi:MAG: adenylyltransferase/cytidyltransferase family protein, partial [Coriobacteriales bacterium]|nr:adenylyltransferase/cytidyltransferase family protein [Coriobacteriales bacterium]
MRNGKRIVITYGTYDLLHYGHIRFLKRARALGDYLIVGVTSDAFDRDRGKLNVFQSLSDRISAIEALGIADKVVVEEYQGQKIEDIRKYGVDIFAIGSDWTGKFDYLNKYCKVVYLDRTEGVSSTELRADKANHVRLGCIGADYLVGRLAEESKHVPNLQLTSIYP